MLVAIAIGSNLGNSLEIARSAVQLLAQAEAVKLVQVSNWYRTRAVVLADSAPQPDYINGCALLETDHSPIALLDLLLETEQKFGRTRSKPWDARTLDLDLLLYGQMIITTERLIVPHPRLIDRAFVLIPLQEIAPHWCHPIAGKTISELARSPADLQHCHPQMLTT